MAWTRRDLDDAHRAYRVWLETRDLAPITVDSHYRYAGFFLRWIYGDYVPRGSADRPDPRPATLGLTVDDLRQELTSYGPFLVAAGLKTSAAPTYVEGARLFMKWIDPETIRDVRLRSPGQAATQPRPRPRSAPDPLDEQLVRAVLGPRSWSSEAAVQASVVAWLVADGWSIERVAHTSSREHGVDVLARKDDVQIAVEVKGYPSDTYTTGERAGEQRKWHPGSQARTYLGDALLAVLLMRDELSPSQIALAIPEVGAFVGLAPRIMGGLRTLGIRLLLVAKDGGVREIAED